MANYTLLNQAAYYEARADKENYNLEKFRVEIKKKMEVPDKRPVKKTGKTPPVIYV